MFYILVNPDLIKIEIEHYKFSEIKSRNANKTLEYLCKVLYRTIISLTEFSKRIITYSQMVFLLELGEHVYHTVNKNFQRFINSETYQIKSQIHICKKQSEQINILIIEATLFASHNCPKLTTNIPQRGDPANQHSL